MTTQVTTKGVELPSFDNRARRKSNNLSNPPKTLSNAPPQAQAKLNNYLSRERPTSSKPTKGIPLKLSSLPPQRMVTNNTESSSVQRHIRTNTSTATTRTQNKNIDMSFKVDEAAKSRNSTGRSREKRPIPPIPPIKSQDLTRTIRKDDPKKGPLRATLSGDRTTTRDRHAPAYRISTDTSSNNKYRTPATRTLETSELHSSRLPGNGDSICVADIVTTTGPSMNTMPSSFVKVTLQGDDEMRNTINTSQLRRITPRDSLYSTIEPVATQNHPEPPTESASKKTIVVAPHPHGNFHAFPGKRRMISFTKSKDRGSQAIRVLATMPYNKENNDAVISNENDQEGKDKPQVREVKSPLQSLMNGRIIRRVSFPEPNAESTLEPSPRNDDVSQTQDTTMNLTIDCMSPEKNTEEKKEVQIRLTRKRPQFSTKKPLGLRNRNKPRGLAGLKNMGNTCFMNAVLQCLFNTPIFSDYFMGGNHNEEKNAQHQGLADSFCNLLGKIRKHYEYPTTAYETPAEFKNCLARVNQRYSGYNQHDAQEFLGTLLEGINQDLNRVITKPSYEQMVADPHRSLQEISNEFFEQSQTRDDSIVTDVFCGQLLSKKTCGTCQSVSIMFDNFWDLALSFEKIPSDSQHLYEMIEKFLAEETLDSLVYCRKCDTITKSKKKFILWRLPKVLVIQIKRFDYTRSRQSKINKSIVFPVQDLDLCKFTKESGDSSVEDAHYTLFGVVNHGGSLNGGHYTAECMNAYNRKWYNYNDATVEETTMESQEAESSFPYVLFYVKASYFNQ